MLRYAALLGAFSLTASPAADAATVQFFEVPQDRFLNPVAVSTEGDVRENRTRT